LLIDEIWISDFGLKMKTSVVLAPSSVVENMNCKSESAEVGGLQRTTDERPRTSSRSTIHNPQYTIPLKRAYLSLGSNLGDRVAKLRMALAMLPSVGVRVTHVSSFYKTEPADFRPQSWFVNCVAEAATDLMPLSLLRSLKATERQLGRRPGIPKGPRAIDIDILLYGNWVVRSAELTIPHQRLAERRFVLVPLREIAPEVRHPVTQLTIREMLANTRDRSQVIRLKDEEEGVGSRESEVGKEEDRE
jgi:2-amino-4-hydroxy-6-hydroxymethyldihydropteridine diphosphokinase